MAYRGSRPEVERRSAEPGVVDDMVRQFADRYAFLRELVQNGIDAGATKLSVRIEREADGQRLTSVEDDGAGMTRATIEGPLLTLFSSSKENDPSKIGKYGVGFVSVFAIEPIVVEVRTRHDEEAWLVRLFGDHSYELLQSERERNGTTVSLVQREEGASFEAHVGRVTEALRKWCRHASVPIGLTVVDALDPAGAKSIAINESLAVPGLVTVVSRQGEEVFTVGAGSVAGAPSTFGGFYNRGLTLEESVTSEASLDGVHFKVESARLSHTISRDGVKRDREHRRVLDEVTRLVRGALHRELLDRIERAAHDVADRGASSEEYRALLAARHVPAFAFASTRGVVLPLVEPVSGRSTIALDAIAPGPSGDVLVADEPSAATRMLAMDGYPVVHGAGASTVLRCWSGRSGVLSPKDALAFAEATPTPESDARDRELTEALATALGRAGFKVRQVRLATFIGLGSTQSFRVVGRTAEHAITTRTEASTREWGRSATLFLNVDDAGVRLARRRAKTDTAIAAQLLCRCLLIADGPLPPRVVDRLLEPVDE